MTRRHLLAGAAAVVLAALAILALRPAGDGGAAGGAGGAAPAFSAADLAGRPVALADFAGRPVLVNFWASWCVPCRREFALLRAVHEAGRAAVVGVVFQDSASAAAAFAAEQGARWPSVLDPGGAIARAYGVGLRPGLPATFAVGPDGRLAARHVGELRAADVDELLAAAR